MSNVVRIGGACGFWGDSAIATPQLLNTGAVDYLVFDYLAETTMAIMSRAKKKQPEKGYATDFVDTVIQRHLHQALEQGVKLVANAGGLNPEACKDAVLAIAAEQGLTPKVAVVLGDDVLPHLSLWQAQGLKDMFTQQPAPDNMWSASVYLGAQSIALALASGADVVITGRCVDSALTLGILAHEFQWSWDDWDRLAAGSLAGHIIECGAQATGGLYTDWEQVPDWDQMGYPLLRCYEDGSFEVTKPEGTGGLIACGAVAEQVLYEIGDPSCYLMPDVTCDFSQVQLSQRGDSVVFVSGAKGRPPTTTYKANGTWQDGYQLQLLMVIRGVNAVQKAHKTADALLQRTRRLMQERGWADYADTCTELLGTGSHYPSQLQHSDLREVVLRIAVRHANKEALALLQRECSSAGTSMGPGTKTSFSGRAPIQPVVRAFSFLVKKSLVPVVVELAGTRHPASVALGDDQAALSLPAVESSAVLSADFDAVVPMVTVPLIDLAWARSGDKGDLVNIGVIARKPEYLPYIQRQLTPERVQKWFAHLVQGQVQRFELPPLQAMNFVLHEALSGGGTASLRSDPLGKSFAQVLLEIPMEVPSTFSR